MVRDLGVRGRPRMGPAQKLVVGLALLGVLAFPAWLFGGSYLKRRDAALTLAREWAIEGPPCVSLTRAEFEARGLKVRKGTVYEGAAFYRAFGHMECSALRYGAGWSQRVYPVCQFTSPRALRVTTGKGDWYYALEPGQPATVSAPNGEARCVLAANFNMQRLNRRQ